jgi:hypothetical protein|tara:strand:- start:493 stop:669 length:177 start_codon:yes stop_codon:yes gene_type:complete
MSLVLMNKKPIEPKPIVAQLSIFGTSEKFKAAKPKHPLMRWGIDLSIVISHNRISVEK